MGDASPPGGGRDAVVVLGDTSDSEDHDSGGPRFSDAGASVDDAAGDDDERRSSGDSGDSDDEDDDDGSSDADSGRYESDAQEAEMFICRFGPAPPSESDESDAGRGAGRGDGRGRKRRVEDTVRRHARLFQVSMAQALPPFCRVRKAYALLFECLLGGSAAGVRRALDAKLELADAVRTTMEKDARCGHEALEEVTADIEAGAWHHFRDRRGRSILMYAIGAGAADVVRMLVPVRPAPASAEARRQVAALLRALDCRGHSVLHYAAHHGTADILCFLHDAIQTAARWEEYGAAGGAAVASLPFRPFLPCGLMLPADGVAATAPLRFESADVAPTPLAIAALTGDEAMVSQILNLGGRDVLLPGDAFEQQLENAGVSVRRGGADGLGRDSALISAVTAGHVPVVQLLLQRGAGEVNGTGFVGETALHRAAALPPRRSGRPDTTLEVMRALLVAGANADQAAQPPSNTSRSVREQLAVYWGGSPLLRCAYLGKDDAVDLLLAHGAKVGSTDVDGDTPVHAAAVQHKHNTIQRLLGHVPVEARRELLLQANNVGKTPLHMLFDVYTEEDPAPDGPAAAAAAAAPAALETLAALHRELEVDVNARDLEGATPLLLAARYAGVQAVRLLLDAGATVDAANNFGETPLMAAIAARCLRGVKLLLEAGANVNAATRRSGETPLHIAVSVMAADGGDATGGRGREAGEGLGMDIIRELVGGGADVNAMDSDERSPVSWAVHARHASLVTELLRVGGDVDWQSQVGSDAFVTIFQADAGGGAAGTRQLELRDAQQSVEHCQLACKLCEGKGLEFVGGLINRALEDGFNRMAAAVLAEHRTRTDERGNTLLLLATQKHWVALVKTLIFEDSTDVEATNDAGESAMVLALKVGCWESFLALYGVGARKPESCAAELMLAAALHQWATVERILRQLGREQAAGARAAAELTPFSSPSLAASAGVASMRCVHARDSAGRASLLSQPSAGLRGEAELVRGRSASAAAELEAGPETKRPRLMAAAGSAAAAPGRTDAGTAEAAQPGPQSLARGGSAAAAEPGQRGLGERGGGGPSPMAAATQQASMANGCVPAGACEGGAAPASSQAAGLGARCSSLGSRGGAVEADGGDAGGGRVGLRTPGLAGPQPARVPMGECKLTWLIDHLMTTAMDVARPRPGQPCDAVRDRILLLLRPMMNFSEKVTHFQEVMEAEAEDAMDLLGDEETMHIEVRRGDHLLVDTVDQISRMEEDDLSRPLTVAFCGEDGEDAGGLLNEFCRELSAAVLKPESALFKEVPEGSGVFEPSDQAHVQGDVVNVSELFRVLGIVVAKCISSRACFPVRFTRSFLKQMLMEAVELADLEVVDPAWHAGVLTYLATDLAAPGYGEPETFTTETHFFGRTATVELKPGGERMPVTNENKHEYVALLAQHKMLNSIKAYVNAFCAGLWACIPLDSLRIFTPEQLGLLVSGRQDISVREMAAAVRYEGFSADDAPVKWFWEMVREMPQRELGALLAFITGSANVPALGFKSLRSPLTIAKAGSMRLPSSHTCINQLVMSEYADKETLRRHFVEVLKQPSGFQFR